jgi:hypothetical protein
MRIKRAPRMIIKIGLIPYFKLKVISPSLYFGNFSTDFLRNIDILHLRTINSIPTIIP